MNWFKNALKSIDIKDEFRKSLNQRDVTHDVMKYVKKMGDPAWKIRKEVID